VLCVITTGKKWTHTVGEKWTLAAGETDSRHSTRCDHVWC